MAKKLESNSREAIVRELLEKAYKPAKDAMVLHPFYRGKLQVSPKCCIRDFDDFSIWYTPGVAEPCKDIQKHPEKVLEHTNKGNFVAVVSDGTRVLGLGNIGPEAGLPVMEGKSILFKYLGGVDAFPICLDTRDADDIIRTVKIIQPTFNGVNLEDIEKPKCFYILNRLRKEMRIPVWHDDQQGTATVTLAGLLNALKVVRKDIRDVKIAFIGAGASNICTANVMMKAGLKPGNAILVDTKGILHPGRTDLKEKEAEKWDLCLRTNSEGRKGTLADAMKGVDVVIALSTPGPGIIKKEWIKPMNSDAIVFACANPIPEIWPWEAQEAGARIIATGRSDFDNQINNSLGFPGIFRGTLDVMATTITDDMCIAAAQELARYAEDKGLSERYIIPRMDEEDVYAREAAAVGLKAVEQGVARIKMSKEELINKARNIIDHARQQTHMLMEQGFIKPPTKT